MTRITAVAFDVDGTLYSEPHLFLRSLFFGLHNRATISCFRAIRRELHCRSYLPRGDIREWQAEQFARRMNISTGEAEDEISRVIYTEWCERICTMPLLKHLTETLALLSSHDIPLAVLSDFPPLVKLQRWNIAHYFTIIINSESTNTLKPHPLPFRLLSDRLQLQPQEILYIGNNINYDIIAAQEYGYMSAYYHDPLRFRFGKQRPSTRVRDALAGCEIVFSHYRHLRSYLQRYL